MFPLVGNFKRNAFNILAIALEQRYDSIRSKTAATA
jgi:hypothetical protein